jgi:hypothetical protein
MFCIQIICLYQDYQSDPSSPVALNKARYANDPKGNHGRLGSITCLQLERGLVVSVDDAEEQVEDGQDEVAGDKAQVREAEAHDGDHEERPKGQEIVEEVRVVPRSIPVGKGTAP